MPPFLQPYIIIIVLIVTMGLFIWGRWRYDVVAMIALTVSVFLGAVPYKLVYTGLSNNAVITVACVMIISHAISHSGIMNHLVRKISIVTRSPILHVGVLSLITAILSAFMNNVGALALMMPVAIKTAIESKRSPSVVLMPLAIASALGGLITVIGTPPNLLISTYRQEITGHPFQMFDYSYVGIPIAVIGIIFIALLGWRLMPGQRKSPDRAEDIFQVQDYITEVRVPESSKVIDMTVRELENLVKGDFVILGLIRNKKKRLVLHAQETFKEKDILIIEASSEDLNELLDVGKLELVADKPVSTDALRTDEVAVVEAVVPQGSRLEGRSSRAIRLRSRFRLNLLAIARQGRPFKSRLNEVNLQAGDVVLLQGAHENMHANLSRLGFLPLMERQLAMRKRGPKAYLSLVIFLIAIILAALRILPVQIAFGAAVVLMMLSNVVPIRTIYDSIDWPIIVLLAAMIPIGNALQSTGGTGLIAHYFVDISGQVSPKVILALLLLVTMTVSDFMNNAATTVVMAPIAATIAQALQVNVDPFLMAVAIGASCSFLTPVGHQNNTLVMGPGGYKFTDYIRLGLPVEVIVLAAGLPLIFWAWPLQALSQ